jgi:hemolysin activation/secretion protein
MRRTSHHGIATLALLIGVAGASGYAVAQNLPATADPSRVGRDTISPSQQMRSLGEPSRPALARPITPAGAADERFVLSAIEISGMTAYSDAEVQKIYARYLGQEISVATLFDIMTDLHNKYLQDGYTLSRVFLPAQDIKDGIAKIDVVEGYINAVELDPSMPSSLVTDDAVRRILAMRPLNTIELERLLLIMNALPRMGVGAILASLDEKSPDAKTPGALRLILRNEPTDEEISGIGIDNHGSVFTGPYQISGFGRVFDVGVAHSTLEISSTLSTSLPEQQFVSLDYSMPILGASGTMLSFTTSIAKTEPGSNLDRLDIKGMSKFIAADISYPVIRQRAMMLKANATFDIRNSKTDILDDLLYDDRLRVLRAGFNFSASDPFYGVTLVDFHYARGLDILGARETGSFKLSRQDGASDFNKMTGVIGRLQSLPRGFELYGLLTGQYAFEPLLSAEEFGFGGGVMGRGYNPSEIAGDRGIAGTLELRYNAEPLPTPFTIQAQPYVFYDAGKVWNIDNNDTTHMSAASSGAGSRFTMEKGWNMDLNLAFPLTRPAQNTPKYSHKYGPRIMFELRKAF